MDTERMTAAMNVVQSTAMNGFWKKLFLETLIEFNGFDNVVFTSKALEIYLEFVDVRDLL